MPKTLARPTAAWYDEPMKTPTTIYFDLDGTVYDLYAQPDWLARITSEKDATVYANTNATLVDIAKLQELLITLVNMGYAIGIISWLPAANNVRKNTARPATNEFKNAVRSVKKLWVRRLLPMATEVHIVQYGTPKHHVALDKTGILVDDNAEVLAAWPGDTIDAKGDILAKLEELCYNNTTALQKKKVA